MPPNLFFYATRELSQDAFFCWLLEWADVKYSSTNPTLNRVGNDFLRLIYSKSPVSTRQEFGTVDIHKQEMRMDVFCLVNNNTAILLEDKVGTKEHDGQLQRYKDILEAWLKKENKHEAANNILPVYIQTGDQSDYSEIGKAGYGLINRCDLLEILESESGKAASKESEIFQQFSSFLREIEDQVQGYAALPLSKWDARSWIGFFMRLQKELKTGNWDYVANPTGGFFGFWWHEQGDASCKQYLQLEQKKFCFKIEVEDKSKRTELRELWHQKLLEEGHRQDLELARPQRFGNGWYMTVATLPENLKFPIGDSSGLLDMPKTMDLIRKAESVLTACREDH